MATIHFLNVLEGDTNIIEHDSGRISVIDISNASNERETAKERAVRLSQERDMMRTRTNVPTGKINYLQKHTPDNPIAYLKNNIAAESIFRFIITHPDMDHLDGISDLFEDFQVTNVWDTDNNKQVDLNNFFAGYNSDDWKFYQALRDGNYQGTSRHTYFSGSSNSYFNEDSIKILCPTKELVRSANANGNDFHDLSYVLLFTCPKNNGGVWKFLFAGDSHDSSWDYILKNHRHEITGIDVLFAPHHGRDSSRSYDFLNVLKPKLTLFGNASSNHLAYDAYPEIRITNNQAGFVVLDVSEDKLKIYVKNFEFAKNFKEKRNWSLPPYNAKFKAYGLIQFSA